MRDDILAINKDIQVVSVAVDVTDAKSVDALWKEVGEKFGRADVLINNAGINHSGPIGEIGVDEWWSDFVSSPSFTRREQWGRRYFNN